jgi:hypothetical protein
MHQRMMCFFAVCHLAIEPDPKRSNRLYEKKEKKEIALSFINGERSLRV